ncbi:hypothetical protein [Streptomyces sp. NPDC048720]|uniref:hypothetical protein n=1 Tax=Streptomyces sp. NPDC048720 TaxID=3365588 RepID=UPI00371344C7
MDIANLAMASATIIAQGFLGEAGKNAWDGGRKFLTAVRTRFRGNGEVGTALARVEEDPTDSDAVNALAFLLASVAERDAQFRGFIAEAVTEARRDGSAPQLVRNYSDFRNASIGKVVNVDTVNGNLNF